MVKLLRGAPPLPLCAIPVVTLVGSCSANGVEHDESRMTSEIQAIIRQVFVEPICWRVAQWCAHGGSDHSQCHFPASALEAVHFRLAGLHRQERKSPMHAL